MHENALGIPKRRLVQRHEPFGRRCFGWIFIKWCVGFECGTPRIHDKPMTAGPSLGLGKRCFGIGIGFSAAAIYGNGFLGRRQDQATLPFSDRNIQRRWRSILATSELQSHGQSLDVAHIRPFSLWNFAASGLNVTGQVALFNPDKNAADCQLRGTRVVQPLSATITLQRCLQRSSTHCGAGRCNGRIDWRGAHGSFSKAKLI